MASHAIFISILKYKKKHIVCISPKIDGFKFWYVTDHLQDLFVGIIRIHKNITANY